MRNKNRMIRKKNDMKETTTTLKTTDEEIQLLYQSDNNPKNDSKIK